MIKIVMSFIFGLIVGVTFAALLIQYKDRPNHRDDIESAYVMGCYVGVDMFISISKDRDTRTCSELKYYRRR